MDNSRTYYGLINSISSPADLQNEEHVRTSHIRAEAGGAEPRTILVVDSEVEIATVTKAYPSTWVVTTHQEIPVTGICPVNHAFNPF